MNTTENTIDLSIFCEPQQPRLATPWVVDGWLYATNCCIAARVPTTEANSPSLERGKRPDLPVLFRVFVATVSEWQAFPHVEQCKRCNGKGTAFGRCSYCKGTGEHECECGHSHECPDCGGEGELDQPCDCVHSSVDPIQLGAAWIKRRFAQLICRLPEPEYLPQPQALERVLFRFAGGQGIVMPIDRSYAP